MEKSVYQFKLKDIHGQPLDLSQFKGKKILFVNTASECGYTPQYQQLQELSVSHKQDLAVIGLPCNDFGAQEPGDEKQIEQFCTSNYAVTFPLTGKIKILGDNPEPLYSFLTKKELNGYRDSEVVWNFQKYLCNENGELIGVFPHNMDPFSDKILNAINNKQEPKS